MNRKIATFVVTATILATSIMPMAVSAQTVSSTGTTSSRIVVNPQNRISNLKTRADSEITRRTTELNNVVTQINGNKRLNTTQKSTLVNNVTSEISKLNTLKAKIDSDTDLPTLITDVKSIISTYRVFAVYIPQTRILIASDKLTDVSSLFTTIQTKLSTIIQTAQSRGKDVSAANIALSDMKLKLADAVTQYTNAENIALGLTPAGYPGNVDNIKAAREALKAAINDFRQARDDVKTIRNSLKEQKVGSSSFKSSISSVSSTSSI